MSRSWVRRAPESRLCSGSSACMILRGPATISSMVRTPVHQVKVRQRAELNKKHVGFVFQQFHLLDDLTVAENLDVPLSYRNVRRSQRQAIVADILDRFQIVAKPSLILADEPTGNLHSDQGNEIMELFKKLNEQGTTIIQVTHSKENAAYSQRIINLRDGWMVD